MRRKGYTPEYGLLFSNVPKKRIRRLSTKLKNIPEEFESRELISQLAMELNVGEDKFYHLIESNAMVELQRYPKLLS